MKTKTKLEGKSYRRVDGIDYLDTFAPTPATAPIRMMTALAREHNLDMYYS